MKKKVFFIIVIIVFILLVKRPQPQEIRIRIIPESNEEQDLLIKEEVKKIVIAFAKENYSKNEEEYINNIEKNLHLLTDEISVIVNDAKVEFKKHTFYNKSYNGSSIKNEEVLTLLVTINSAQGDNWWGSIYPNFLGMESSEVTEYKSFFQEVFNNMKG